MKISIIGTGLIGGSFALALQKHIPDVHLIGWDEQPEHRAKAQELGIVHEVSFDLKSACASSDYIFLAIPVHSIEAQLTAILDLIQPKQTLVDFGSTKETICHTADGHPHREQFIAAHPIAGTEFSGPKAALADLFTGKNMIICDAEKSTKYRISAFQKLCETLGMKVNYMNARQHDIHLAYVSHLSHVLAFSLSNTVLEKEKSEEHLLNLAGSGFESTVRLAKSNPDMWAPIFRQNKNAVLESIDSYMNQLTLFREMLASGDEPKLRDFLNDANQITKILKK